MRAFTLLVMLALVSIQALAQTQPEPPKSSRISPGPKGRPHICRSNYPQAAVQDGRQGAVLLTFEVTADGTVDAVTIAASSGSFDLDLASTGCASKWLYEPAKSDGVAVSVPWHATVSWTLGDHSSLRFAVPKPQEEVSSCVKAYPGAAQRGAVADDGISVIRYRLADGVVTEAVLNRSSGDAVLDKFAVDCVKGWKFKSDYENGKPATGIHSAIIDWKQKVLLKK